MAGMDALQTPEQIARTAGFPMVPPVTGAPMPRPVIPTAQEAVTNTLMRPVANAVQTGVQVAQQAQVPDWIRQLASALVPQQQVQAQAQPPVPTQPAPPRMGMPPGFMPVAQRPTGAISP